METVLAILTLYFYGVGHPPVVKAVQVQSVEACRVVLSLAKAEALKLPDVRDARGGCMTIVIPQSRNKT